jgi:YHS domain-containing protein
MATEMMATDPVCGMRVDPRTASRTSEYQGQTYYFCAPACRKTFEANPEPYAARLRSGQPIPDEMQAGSGGCGCCRS